jgi:hypothetical protein
LLKQYDLSYDVNERQKILRQIDDIYTNSHQIIMEWYAPYQRVAYWNRYGMPEGYLTRVGDYRDLFSLWWIDPDKSRKLDEALKDSKIKPGEGNSEDKYWQSPERSANSKQYPPRQTRNDELFHSPASVSHSTFLGITVVVFGIMQIVPGGPVERMIYMINHPGAAGGEAGVSAGRTAGVDTQLSAEAIEQMKQYYGYDKPIPVRYGRWLWKLLHFDLGTSYTYGDPVWEVIRRRFRFRSFSDLTGFLLTYLVCIPLGVLKAIKHGSKFDFASSVLVLFGYSIPAGNGDTLTGFAGGGTFPQSFSARRFRPDNWEYLGFFEKIVQQIYYMALPVACYMVALSRP